MKMTAFSDVELCNLIEILLKRPHMATSQKHVIFVYFVVLYAGCVDHSVLSLTV
jgi:hypothetical protein